MSDVLDNDGVRARRLAACPLCGGGLEPLYAGLADRLYAAPGRWDLRRCVACGVACLDPQPLAEETPKLYTRYFTHAEPSPDDTTRGGLRGRVRDAILARRLGYPLSPARPWGALLAAWPALREVALGTVLWLPANPGARLLDVGCGNGEFLTRMRAHGWDVEGVEPDADAARLARTARGLRVHDGDLETVTLPAASFDVVTLNHVIEHVVDPAALVRRAAALLRPGGRLCVVTPNLHSRGHREFRAAWVHLDPPRHLVLFHAAALRDLVRGAGLALEAVHTSARDARWVFAASTAVRDDGRLVEGRVAPGALLRARALAFQWREDGDPEAGEELVLAARRDETAGLS